MSSRPEHLVSAPRRSHVIERELGRGGMATVYLADDRKHHRKVAVKVLLPEVAAALGAQPRDQDRMAMSIQLEPARWSRQP